MHNCRTAIIEKPVELSEVEVWGGGRHRNGSPSEFFSEYLAANDDLVDALRYSHQHESSMALPKTFKGRILDHIAVAGHGAYQVMFGR